MGKKGQLYRELQIKQLECVAYMNSCHGNSKRVELGLRRHICETLLDSVTTIVLFSKESLWIINEDVALELWLKYILHQVFLLSYIFVDYMIPV